MMESQPGRASTRKWSCVPEDWSIGTPIDEVAAAYARKFGGDEKQILGVITVVRFDW